MSEPIYSNLFYFRLILKIGGTEQFLYEIAKKYHAKDITILYDEADFDQLARLKKLVRCIKRQPNKTYKAKRAFYNFNLEAIDQVKADEHIFICHAIYQNIDQIPPVNHPKLTRFIGVSKFASRELEKYAEHLGKKIKAEPCYNPLTLEKPKKILKIVSAGRFNDKVKGGDRLIRLAGAVEKYARENGEKYIWLVFTNRWKIPVSIPNFFIMEPRIDVRDCIADADWLVQLSNDMESYGYSINEALGYGTGVVHTPLSVIPELNIPDEAHLTCEYDMSNADEIAEKMFTQLKEFTYTPPEDGWDKLLVDTTSNYEPPKADTEVECIERYYDLELKRTIEVGSPTYKIERERANYLSSLGLVKILKKKK